MTLFYLLLLSLAPLAFSAELEGIKMPDSVKVGGKELVLNGMAVRKYSIFKVSVYVGGLYLEKKNQDEKEILASKGTKQVRMEFLKPGPAEGARDAWRDFLKANWEGEWEKISPVAEQYLALLIEVKTGDVMVHDFFADKVVVYQGEKKLGEVSDPRFPALLLSTWIGKKPSTEELKQGLLGK